jgi:hypothetical protein
MSAGDRTHHGDQHEQDRAGRERIGEQRDGVFSRGQMLGHDSGADDAGK